VPHDRIEWHAQSPSPRTTHLTLIRSLRQVRPPRQTVQQPELTRDTCHSQPSRRILPPPPFWFSMTSMLSSSSTPCSASVSLDSRRPPSNISRMLFVSMPFFVAYACSVFRSTRDAVFGQHCQAPQHDMPGIKLPPFGSPERLGARLEVKCHMAATACSARAHRGLAGDLPPKSC